MDFITLGTVFVQSAVFRFVSPARTLGTNWTLCLDSFNYLLLLILHWKMGQSFILLVIPSALDLVLYL